MPLPPPVSRALVGAYARAYRVDLDEAEPLNGRGAYPSFDSFFTRRLRDGVRECRAPTGALVSPADGRLDMVGSVEREGTMLVKGRPYRACDLLGDEREADRYLGGQFAIVYLSPRDYHRVHAPAAGTLTEIRSYPGEHFPVNGVSERHIPGYLARNRRVAIVLDSDSGVIGSSPEGAELLGSSPEGSSRRRLGRITIVMVAAMIVGRITATGIGARDVPFGTHRLTPAPKLERGAEVGIFHLGSSAVVFVEPGSCCIERAPGPITLGAALTAEVGPGTPLSHVANGAARTEAGHG